MALHQPFGGRQRALAAALGRELEDGDRTLRHRIEVQPIGPLHLRVLLHRHGHVERARKAAAVFDPIQRIGAAKEVLFDDAIRQEHALRLILALAAHRLYLHVQIGAVLHEAPLPGL